MYELLGKSGLQRLMVLQVLYSAKYKVVFSFIFKLRFLKNLSITSINHLITKICRLSIIRQRQDI